MIQEAYVSFETAKLLKEKGFIGSGDIGCKDGFYSESACESGYGIITSSGQEVGLVFDDLDNSDLEWNEYLRPTQSIAMRWLREVHNIQLWVEPYEYDEGTYNAHVRIKWFINQWQGVGYKSFEEACEVAIKYCLENLIK